MLMVTTHNIFELMVQITDNISKWQDFKNADQNVLNQIENPINNVGLFTWQNVKPLL